MAIDLGSLGDLFITVGADVSGLDSDLAKAVSSAEQAGQKMADAFSGGFKQVGDQLELFTPLAQQVGQQMSFAFTEAANGINTFTAGIQNAQPPALNFGQWLQSFGEDLNSVGGKLKDVGGSFVALGAELSIISAAVVGLGEKALETAGKFEQWQVAFANMLGSGEAAKKMLADLTEFAISTPFNIPGVVENAQKLIAFGFEAEQVIPILRSLGDAASGTAKGAEGLKSLTLAFGEMNEKGVAQLRQLNMLTLQGVPAIEMLANAYSVSTEQMTSMISKKLVPAAEAIPILLEGINTKFGGMMEQQSKTLLGMWSNLQDELTKTFKAVGDTMLPTFKDIEGELFNILGVVQSVAEGFGELPAPIQEAALAMAALLAVAGPAVLAVGGLVYGAGQLATAIGTLSEVFPAFGEFVEGLTLASGAASALEVAIAAVGVVILSLQLVEVVKDFEDLWSITKELTNNFAALKDAAARVGNALTGILPAEFVNAWETVKKSFSDTSWADLIVTPLSTVHALLQTVIYDFHIWKGDSVDMANEVVKNLDRVRLANQLNAEQAIHGAEQTREAYNSVIAAQNKADEAYQQAKATYDSVLESYNRGETSIDAVNRAQIALNKAFTDAHPVIKQHGQDIDELGQTEAKFFEQTFALLNKVPADFADFQAGLAKGFNFQSLDRQLIDFVNKLKDSGEASEGFVQTLIDSLDQAHKRLEVFTSAKEWDDAVAKMASIGSEINNIAKFTQEGTQLMGLAFNNAKVPLDTFSKSLNALGIVADGETKKLSTDLTAFNVVLQSNASTLGTVESAWSRVMEAARKVANDPESWGKLQQAAGAYLAKLQEMGAPLQAQLAAEREILQLELDKAKASSQDAESTLSLSEALSNVEIHQRALLNQTMALSDLYTGMVGTFGKLWDNFDKGIADAIVSGKNFGQVMGDVLKQFETQITELVTHYLLGQLKDSFLQNTNALQDFGKVFNSVFGVGGGGSGGGTQSWQDLPLGMPKLGDVAGGSTQAAGQIQQLTSGILGTLSETINMISGIGTLITGIIQSFQNARMETTLNAIESNTRRSTQANELAYNEAHTGWIELTLLRQDFDGWFHDAFASLMSTVEELRDIARAGGSPTGSYTPSGSGDETVGSPALAPAATLASDAVQTLSGNLNFAANSATDLSTASASLDTTLKQATNAYTDSSTVIDGGTASVSNLSQQILSLMGTLRATNSDWQKANDLLTQASQAGDIVAEQLALTLRNQATGNALLVTQATQASGAISNLSQQIEGLFGTLRVNDADWKKANDLLNQAFASGDTVAQGLAYQLRNEATGNALTSTFGALFNLPKTVDMGTPAGGTLANPVSSQTPIVININGTIYGQGGAQMVGTELTNALRTIASQKVY